MEKIDPFIWNDDNDRSCGKLKLHEVIDIKLKLAHNTPIKDILADYDFITPSMLSKMRIGRAYANVLPQLNDILKEGKRERKDNDPQLAKEVYEYYLSNDKITDKEVSKHFDISITKAEYIRRLVDPFDKILSEFGYTEPILYQPSVRKADPELVKTIKEKLKNNGTISGVAKELGISRTLIQDIVYHRGAYKD